MDRPQPMTPTSGPLPFPTQDARAWVRAFRETNPDANVDDDAMLGWFANAIEHGRGPAADWREEAAKFVIDDESIESLLNDIDEVERLANGASDLGLTGAAIARAVCVSARVNAAGLALRLREIERFKDQEAELRTELAAVLADREPATPAGSTPGEPPA